jgi:hypothetical protein
MSAVRHATVLAVARPVLLLVSLAVSTPVASADSISKEQCIEAHGKGQDAKDQGKLTVARKLFLSCAQPACPALIQGDCARFADDLTRQQSSLTFLARDAQGSDLPDNAVYIDDALVATRLDDGRPHEVDPGRHTVRFSTQGKDQTVTLVVGTGEKGRSVVANFTMINAAAAGSGGRNGRTPAGPPEPKVLRPKGALAVMVAGGVVAAAGIGLSFYGVSKVPSNCSLSSHHCSAPPGDPVFDDAKSGALILDVGLGVSVIGLAALAGGTYWYITGSHTEKLQVAVPVITRDTAGVAFTGRF